MFENLAQTLVAVDASLCLLFIHPPAHGSEVSPAARNTLDSARIPRTSKLLICGLFQKGRVLAQDAVARWLEKAAQVCRRFNHRRIAGFAAEELQADEIRTFAGNKKTPSWVFVTIEVWVSALAIDGDGKAKLPEHSPSVSRRMNFERLPLIVTDGFEFYQKVIRRFFGPACLYGQVLKTRRNDRIIKVERRALHGAAWRFEDALNNSEDSSTLNTSFIERLNLTIRQSSAYLSRRTLSHARSTERLDEHLELLRCYYNFVRPHGALKFGREIRTPAMQAGLTTRRLTFRDIFLATTIPLWSRIEVFLLSRARNPVLCQNSALLKDHGCNLMHCKVLVSFCQHLVLPPSSVGEMTLKHYSALSYN